MRANHAAHPIENVGAELRGMMLWIVKNKLVDKGEELVSAAMIRDRTNGPGGSGPFLFWEMREWHILSFYAIGDMGVAGVQYAEHEHIAA